MENNNWTEGWLATDIDGTHLFVNKPCRANFGTHSSWVGYEINIKDVNEPIKVKINFDTEITHGSKSATLNKIAVKNKFGYNAVDLGLPSGILWCDRNVGAKSPEDYGFYFAWGETEGYLGVTEDKSFCATDYKWFSNDRYKHRKTLDLSDDAAHVNMGGDWHMPTDKQIQELIENTVHSVDIVNGKKGMRYISKKDTSKSIFVPFAGYCDDGIITYCGSYGGFWSSIRHDDVSSSYTLYCGSSGDTYLSDLQRFCGFSIRGVIWINK